MKPAASARDHDFGSMLLIFAFFMGIANFAMHKAVAESGHPIVEQAKQFLGPYGSYVFELALLIGAMSFVNEGARAIALMYTAYTAVNGFASWIVLSGRG